MASRSNSLGSLRRWWSGWLPGRIDDRIAYHLGHGVAARLQVHWTQLPDYRFVDAYRATERYCAGRGEIMRVDSEHEEDLNNILHGKPPSRAYRQIKIARKVAWSTGPAEEEYLPVDVFWLCKKRPGDDGSNLIVRLRNDPQYARVILEAASDDAGFAERSVTAIVELSAQHSIYRNRILELSHEVGGKDAYGNIDPTARLRVLFKAHEGVADYDIVIDDEVRQILQRNVIDLHIRRDVLKTHRVPVRRGVLFYGPPGTGKTYACRYLCGKLPEVTRIIVTGTALMQVNTIFSLARMLQPSLVILEDVDLVFQAREVNLLQFRAGRPARSNGRSSAVRRHRLRLDDQRHRTDGVRDQGPPRQDQSVCVLRAPGCGAAPAIPAPLSPFVRTARGGLRRAR